MALHPAAPPSCGDRPPHLPTVAFAQWMHTQGECSCDPLLDACRISRLATQILQTTSPFNWRLREKLAQQLPRLAPLLTLDSVFFAVVPVAFGLLNDPVSVVRERAFEVMRTPVCVSLEGIRWVGTLSWCPPSHTRVRRFRCQRMAATVVAQPKTRSNPVLEHCSPSVLGAWTMMWH